MMGVPRQLPFRRIARPGRAVGSARDMHAKIPSERLEGLLGADAGLSEAEAAARRARHGRNDIVEAAPPTWWMLARDTLRDPMLWFLLGTACLFA